MQSSFNGHKDKQNNKLYGRKDDNLYLIKIKIYFMKDTVKKMKNQVIIHLKIFTKHVSDTVLVPYIHGHLLKFNKNKSSN